MHARLNAGHGSSRFTLSTSSAIVLVAIVFACGLLLLPLLRAFNERREMRNVRKALFENNMGGLADRINEKLLFEKQI